MNIAPVSNYNNQSFQCKNGKFAKGLKKFCGHIIENMERSTTSVAKARMGLFDPFRDTGRYIKKRY